MKQVIHSKFKPMKREPLFVALSNQKGGVGKSTFTVLLASYFHYLNGYNVLVVDCDYPQHSISAMRDWEVGNIEKNVHLQNQLVEQFGTSGRKAYSILNSTPEEARETAGRFLEKSDLDYDLVLFDLPGTVNVPGVFQSVINMDYVFTPITQEDGNAEQHVFCPCHQGIHAPACGRTLAWHPYVLEPDGQTGVQRAV